MESRCSNGKLGHDQSAPQETGSRCPPDTLEAQGYETPPPASLARVGGSRIARKREGVHTRRFKLQRADVLRYLQRSAATRQRSMFFALGSPAASAWPACSYEFAEVLRRRQTSVMVRPAVHDLAQLERTGKTRRISSYSELTNSAWTCRHSGEFALRDALVRLMPSASMS